jgi:hypothetical protein
MLVEAARNACQYDEGSGASLSDMLGIGLVRRRRWLLLMFAHDHVVPVEEKPCRSGITEPSGTKLKGGSLFTSSALRV